MQDRCRPARGLPTARKTSSFKVFPLLLVDAIT